VVGVATAAERGCHATAAACRHLVSCDADRRRDGLHALQMLSLAAFTASRASENSRHATLKFYRRQTRSKNMTRTPRPSSTDGRFTARHILASVFSFVRRQNLCQENKRILNT